MNVMRKASVIGVMTAGLTLLALAPAEAAYPPPTTAPKSTPAPKPKPRVTVITPVIPVTTAVVTGGAAPFTLSCTKACSGTILLQYTITVRVKVKGKYVNKKVVETLGTAPYHIKKSGKNAIRLPLNATGKKATATASKKPIKVTLIETPKGGKPIKKVITIR